MPSFLLRKCLGLIVGDVGLRQRDPATARGPCEAATRRTATWPSCANMIFGRLPIRPAASIPSHPKPDIRGPMLLPFEPEKLFARRVHLYFGSADNRLPTYCRQNARLGHLKHRAGSLANHSRPFMRDIRTHCRPKGGSVSDWRSILTGAYQPAQFSGFVEKRTAAHSADEMSVYLKARKR